MSRLVSLEQFGYYNLAWTLAGGLTMFSAPVFVAVFPRLVQLAESRDEKELSRIYHEATQLLSFMVCAAAVVCTIFGKEVLQAWLGEKGAVMATYPIVIPIVIGSALNALMNVPYALQLAFGWTRLTAVTNAVATVVIVPLTYVLASRFGARGAAMGWAILNAGVVVFGMRLVHKRLLKGELSRWYSRGIALPLVGALVPALAIRGAYAFHETTRLRELAIVVAATAACIVGAAALAGSVRARAIAFATRASRRLAG
jgi:O-antigen/teichoic acid export membrane protein